MRRAVIGALLVSGVAAAVFPAGAAAAEYTTYVGCGRSASTVASHECEVGQRVGAFFESDEDAEYDICVEFPLTELLCVEEQSAEAGVLYVNAIETDQPGTHHVHWYLTGTESEIGTWSFDMREPAPPAPPPPLPAISTTPIPIPVPVPVPVVVPSQESSACVNARRRVRRIRKRLRLARPAQKPVLRGKLRRARAAARRAC